MTQTLPLSFRRRRDRHRELPTRLVDTALHWRPGTPRDRARERSPVASRAHASHLRSDGPRPGERQPGIGQVRVPVEVRSRRRAPRQPAGRPGGHAARTSALGAPSSAVGRHACGRPRRGAVAAVLPHWDDDDDRLPGGRLTRALPPRANGHDRGAWCERRNRTASARWGPRLPGQPASRLHWHAFVRAAFDNIGSDRRGLRARHADTHAQSITRGARGLKVRRSRSIGPAKAAS